MIHVSLAPEPILFHSQVREPGLWAVAELAGEVPNPPRLRGKARKAVAASRAAIPAAKFPSLWTLALPDMLKVYQEICAYCCLRIHPVTGAASVDHMAPKSRAWDQVYEWSNYRLAAARLNSRKNSFLDVVDPCENIDGWFVLELVDFQVLPSPALQVVESQRVLDTIQRLKLNDFDLRDTRAAHAEYYWSGEITFAHLQRESPFVARELERLGRK